MIKVVIFASGSGSNAEKIIQKFNSNNSKSISHVFCNKPNAGVLKRAKELNTPSWVFTKEELNNGSVLEQLKEVEADFIVLAGFLLKLPEDIIKAYPNKIVNIHPALLPKYGGKGMYGNFVHEAVVKNKEKETGITIHYVNENYDEGAIIFQKSFEVQPEDDAQDVAQKIHVLEHKYFPEVIENLLSLSK